MHTSAPIHVTENSHLAELAERWRERSLLAFDTEFVRETTFYPIAGLLQLGDGEHQYLIDPLTISDWSPLRAVFSNASRKILHACSEDLEVFYRLLDVLPQPLFDTQVGAALAGIGFSLSYQVLVQTCLGIVVEKEQTRSDWVRRPLSAAQCHYAALDVAYLPDVFAQIAERLSALGRFEWWCEEGARTLTLSREHIASEQYYLKLSAGWRLRGAQVAVLQQLCHWREQQARVRNVPRGHIVKDAQCLEIARCLPRNLAQLATAELHSQQIRLEGETILAIVDSAQQSPATSWPQAPEAPLPREWGERLKRLRQLITDRAAELNMPAEILARKRDCEVLLRTGALPESLRGWRLPVIGEDLLNLSNTMV